MTSERELLAEHLAQTSHAQAALVDGMLAASEEADDRRAKSAFRKMAQRIAAGQRLEDVLNEPGTGVADYLRGAIRGGVEAGDLGSVLAEYLEHESRLRELRRSVWQTLAYPVCLLVLLSLVVLLVGGFLLPLITLVWELETDLEIGRQSWKGIVPAVVWLGTVGVRMLVTLSAVVLVIAALLRCAAGPGRWRWFLTTMPLVGPIWLWTGAVEFASMLRILLSRRVPLTDALQITSHGLRDANMRDVARQLAAALQRGIAPASLMAGSNRVPATMALLWKWGEDHGDLPDALRLAAEMCLGRIRLRMTWMNAVIPPAVYFFVAVAAAVIAVTVVVAMLRIGSPMLNLM
jgi:type II secretory pathway component PulF